MSNSKRKIAGALMLGATLTGTVGSSVTSAGLFDWFKKKDDLIKIDMEKQTNGYSAAISVAKRIYKLEKEKEKEKEENKEKEKENKKENNKDEKKDNKSVLEILEDLFFEKVKNANKNENENSAYTEYLENKVICFLKSANNVENIDVVKKILEKTKEYCAIKRSNNNNNNNNNEEDVYVLDKDASTVKQELNRCSVGNNKDEDIKIDEENSSVVIVKSEGKFVNSRMEKLYKNGECVKIENLKYKFSNKVTYITILAKDILSLKKIVDNICNSLSESIKDQEDKNDPTAECIEKLISTVKNSKIANGSEQDIGISYEDIINKLINEKMKENFLNYRSNFGKIFEPVNLDNGGNNKIEKKDLAFVLHDLGYEEHMGWLPSWEEKSLGRLGRLAVVPVATTALGLAVAPILPVAGIAGLLCSSLISQTVASTFNIVRHKELTSFHPSNWEVGKFVGGVFRNFVSYSIFGAVTSAISAKLLG